VGQVRDAADYEKLKKKLACYIGVNFKHGASVAHRAIENLQVHIIQEPQDPPPGATAVELKKWEADLESDTKEKKAWEEARPRMYQLILVPCHPDMEQKLQAP
jgi:hypothetical protein